MSPQNDIDSVLREAQEAVDDLVQDVAGVTDLPPPAPPDASAHPAVRNSSPSATAASPPPSRFVPRILQLRVPVVVRLAERKMLVDEIMKLVPGTILEFDRKCDAELDLLVNNHQIGSGLAVKVDEHFGLRVSFIGDLQERINSLAG